MEFYNNKKNDTLKFSVNADGIDTSDMEARLILHTKENKNYIFFGEIEGNKCSFNIPELDLYEKEDHGKIKFEIISEDVYFNVWEDKFEIKTKPTIKIEEMIQNIQNESKKPKITASPIVVERVNEKKNKKQELIQENDVDELGEDNDLEDVVYYGHWTDDLKSNCRSSQNSGDIEDARFLGRYLSSRHPELSDDEAYNIAKDWTNSEEPSNDLEDEFIDEPENSNKEEWTEERKINKFSKVQKIVEQFDQPSYRTFRKKWEIEDFNKKNISDINDDDDDDDDNENNIDLDWVKEGKSKGVKDLYNFNDFFKDTLGY